MSRFFAIFLGLSGWISASLAEGLRAPSAMAVLDNGKTLAVTLERRGGLALIDLEKFELRSFTGWEGEFTDLVVLEDDLLLATDSVKGRVILIRVENSKASVVATEAVAAFPVTAVAQQKGGMIFVASLWSKQITAIKREDESNLQVAGTIDLPFEPREQLLVADETRLVVADAFGGNLALIDTDLLKVLATRKIQGHNIRGLAMDRDEERLLISHQDLNRLAQTSFDDVHWGMFLTNKVRSASIESFFAPNSPTELWSIGDVGRAGGDPDDLLVLEGDRIVVALAGVGEIAIGEFGDRNPKRIQTGARPASILVDEWRDRLFVANQLDDLITVIDLKSEAVRATISLSPGTLPSAQARGEQLFFNARVSHDGWFSCHSCHTNGHTNGLVADTMGDGGFNSPKQIPSLFGLAETAPFGWLGGKESLADQLRSSIHTTMRNDHEALPEHDVEDLAAFLKTLSPPTIPTPADAEAIARGSAVFQSQKCDRCHSGKTLTTADVFDVDLPDELGNREFNPPSLRGVGLRRRFFHDGRAKSLEAVFAELQHQLESPLSDLQIADLVAFLRSR
ncbi:MAG: YVTN family beta-propeller protein [Verrucomicrobiales bacterium]|jgi:YVTN family beta-propeller protein